MGCDDPGEATNALFNPVGDSEQSVERVEEQERGEADEDGGGEDNRTVRGREDGRRERHCGV